MESLKTSEAAKEVKHEVVAEKPVEPASPVYVMPDLQNGPASFYDTETCAFWVGIPVNQMDFLTATVLLDRSKFDLLQHFQHYVASQQAKSKIVKPWQEKARETFNGMMRKLHS